MISEISCLPSEMQTNSSWFVYGLDLSGTAQGAGTIGGLLSLTTQQPSNSTTAFYCYDANGNVADLVGTNGAFLAQYQYDPNGNLIAQISNPAISNTFKFSTKYFDAETGLYYYGHRYYQSESGRWVSRDPIAELGGANLYAGMLNDPINAADPVGLSAQGVTCKGKPSCKEDCKWTGPVHPDRISGDRSDWWWHQIGKWIPRYSSPPLQAHWKDQCATEYPRLDEIKTLYKPTPGSSDIGREGTSGGVMSIESRWWAIWPLGYNGDDTGATANSAGTFCCCKDLQ
jgi:RHS repeat-associated protein